MSCCGQQRLQVAASSELGSAPVKKQAAATHVFFQYLGSTGLTTMGTATGGAQRAFTFWFVTEPD